jgi:tubulin gamma
MSDMEWGLTSRVQLFKRMLDQYDRLRKRNAFLEQYKKEDMFANGLEEFDDSRRVVAELEE